MAHTRQTDGIAQRVRTLRLNLGLTQRQVGGPRIHYSYISRIEQGHRMPSDTALRIIAARLGTTAHFLLTGQPDPYSIERERSRLLVEIAKLWRDRAHALERRVAADGIKAPDPASITEALTAELQHLRERNRA